VARLWPGREAWLVTPRVTNDCFALAVAESRDAPVDVAHVRQIFTRFGAVSIEERDLEVEAR
jgi:hypothetical protein